MDCPPESLVTSLSRRSAQKRPTPKLPRARGRSSPRPRTRATSRKPDEDQERAPCSLSAVVARAARGTEQPYRSHPRRPAHRVKETQIRAVPATNSSHTKRNTSEGEPQREGAERVARDGSETPRPGALTVGPHQKPARSPRPALERGPRAPHALRPVEKDVARLNAQSRGGSTFTNARDGDASSVDPLLRGLDPHSPRKARARYRSVSASASRLGLDVEHHPSSLPKTTPRHQT